MFDFVQTADRNVSRNRACYRQDGKPKQAYATFDEAMEAVASAYGFVRSSKRLHVYACPDHRYHVGSPMDRSLESRQNSAEAIE